MSVPPRTAGPLITDLTKFCKSVLNVTFVLEIVGLEVFHDCNEGWLDLGPCVQGFRLQYQLYYGRVFDIDVLIWPHVAKIWCGPASGWVRTWQFHERRFLAFSINHAFPVRITDLQLFVATVTPFPGIAALSSNAKNDKNSEVYLPSLSFGERRYFAHVVETPIEEPLDVYISKLIWNAAIQSIPSSYLDAEFDKPQPVTDVRHQDAVLYHVNEIILSQTSVLSSDEDDEDSYLEHKRSLASKDHHKKDANDKKKQEKPKSEKFELTLTGDSLLAGIGRIVPFETPDAESPGEMGELRVLIGSKYLPAQDDWPLIFINIDTLFDVPQDVFKNLRITHLYTRWALGDEVHDSEKLPVKAKKQTNKYNDFCIKFNDHHSIPAHPDLASKMIAIFLDSSFQVQLRGIKLPSPSNENMVPTFFGYKKHDKDFSYTPKLVVEELDFIIAITKIDARALTKGINAFIRGEYPLYPPPATVKKLEREGICTNDINGIGIPVTPVLVVPPSAILEAQMSIEVSLGLVGCRPCRLDMCYSRMFLLSEDSESIMEIIRAVLDLNEELAHGPSENVLTGFAIDTGDCVIFFLEGPRDGHILKVWEMTDDYDPKVKPVFSTSARYSTKVYTVPFVVLKMYVPISVLLACPPVYTRPAVPLPTRSALLKLGRLIGQKRRIMPCRADMPTADELKSFRLELCSPMRPPINALPGFKPPESLPVMRDEDTNVMPLENNQTRVSMQSVNWIDDRH